MKCIKEVRPKWQGDIKPSLHEKKMLLIIYMLPSKSRALELIDVNKVGKTRFCWYYLADPRLPEKLVEMLEYCAKPQSTYPCQKCPAAIKTRNTSG